MCCTCAAGISAFLFSRKMVHRVATSELTFGQMPAPPPSSVYPEVVGVADVLACFTEDGLPVDTHPLSPIAVVSLQNEDTPPSLSIMDFQ